MRITQTRDQIAAALRVLGLPTGAIVFRTQLDEQHRLRRRRGRFHS